MTSRSSSAPMQVSSSDVIGRETSHYSHANGPAADEISALLLVLAEQARSPAISYELPRAPIISRSRALLLVLAAQLDGPDAAVALQPLIALHLGGAGVRVSSQDASEGLQARSPTSSHELPRTAPFDLP